MKQGLLNVHGNVCEHVSELFFHFPIHSYYETHSYYAQVQGQMGVGKRPWCDFVVYTKKGISVERVPFNETYWNNKLLPKRIEFYDSCVLPEIVSPVHALGLPVRDLRS